MTAFQVIALGVLGLFTALTLAGMLRGRRGPGALWLLVWIAAGVAVVAPDATTWLAHFLGIERGADLVFYAAVLGGFIGFFFVVLKLRRHSRQITILTRQLAIANARRPGDGSAGPGPAAPGERDGADGAPDR